MNTYNDHLRGSHAAAQMRRLPSLAPDSLDVEDSDSSGRKPVAAIAFKPTFTLALDDVDRIAMFASPDPQHRIALAKTTGPLGWSAGQALVAMCAPGSLTVRAGVPTGPTQQPVSLDAKGRLRVGPSAAALLRLAEDAQVLAIAVPAAGELLLLPAAAALAQLTGPIAASPTPEPKPKAEPRASNVRGRWKAPGAA